MPALNRTPIASLDLARDVLTPIQESLTGLMFERSDVFSSILPGSGSMRSGVLYSQPMLVPRTSGSVSSSSRGLPTVRSSDANGGACTVTEEQTSGLLPTPSANLADKGGTQDPQKRRAGGHTVGLDDVVRGL